MGPCYISPIPHHRTYIQIGNLSSSAYAHLHSEVFCSTLAIIT